MSEPTPAELAERAALLFGWQTLPSVGQLRERIEHIRYHRVHGTSSDEQELDDAGIAQLAEAEASLVSLARVDPITFNAYVLRDEETGEPILNEPQHEDWHEFLSKNRFAVLWAAVESGKSTQISVGRVLWELGKNHNLRTLVLSNTDSLARKIARQIGDYIEKSRELHRVFPTLKRDKSKPWNQHVLFVERAVNARDPSVQTSGIHGNILGSRLDLCVGDDFLDHENTRTTEQREEVARWLGSTLDGRITRNGRIWLLGNVWDKDDAMHRRAKLPAYASLRAPIIDKRTGVLAQPRRWPLERIEFERSRTLPNDFARQRMCETTEASDKSPFKPAYIAKCIARGQGRGMAYRVNELGHGERIYTGVDLGPSDKEGSDLTVLFTILFPSNEDRVVLCCESGNWDGPEIVDRIVDVHARFNSIVFVEDVAAQKFILQFARKQSAVPVRPFTTGGTAKKGEAALANKNHPEWGFEAMAVEFYNAKWVIPNRGGVCHPELQAWQSELQLWEPGQHVGDRAMASWICVQGSKFGRAPGKVRDVRVPFANR